MSLVQFPLGAPTDQPVFVDILVFRLLSPTQDELVNQEAILSTPARPAEIELEPGEYYAACKMRGSPTTVIAWARIGNQRISKKEQLKSMVFENIEFEVGS